MASVLLLLLYFAHGLDQLQPSLPPIRAACKEHTFGPLGEPMKPENLPLLSVPGFPLGFCLCFILRPLILTYIITYDPDALLFALPLPALGSLAPPLPSPVYGFPGEFRDEEKKFLDKQYPPTLRTTSIKSTPRIKSIFLDFPLPLWFSFSAMGSSACLALYFAF